MRQRLTLTVNGVEHELEVDTDRTLLSVLRDDLDLTGTKYGCGEGQCGACTVLIDDTAARSCRLKVRSAAGKSITTIEGVANGDGLHPLQEAFVATGAMQCGYCTSGMIVSALNLLRREPQPDRARIVEAMQGNICRCGVYPRVVRAIEHAAKAMKEGGPR